MTAGRAEPGRRDAFRQPRVSPQKRQEGGCAGVCGDCLSKVCPQLKNHAEHCRGLQKEWTLGGDDPCDPSAREVGQGSRVFGGITGYMESGRPASQTEAWYRALSCGLC